MFLLKCSQRIVMLLNGQLQTLFFFIEVHVPRKEIEWSSIWLLGVTVLPLSTCWVLDIGTVWYFFAFVYLILPDHWNKMLTVMVYNFINRNMTNASVWSQTTDTIRGRQQLKIMEICIQDCNKYRIVAGLN